MIGLSTSWLSERENITGREVIEEVLALGFKAIELEYRLTGAMFEEMRPFLLNSKMKIRSIHNFFPFPDGLPPSNAGADLYLLSSPDREERDRAVRMTIRTIEYAQDLGAEAVVLHLGWVEMDAERDRLYSLFEQGRLESPEGRLFIETKLKERREKRGVSLESVLHCLDRLNREAERRGVLLGVENRYTYHEIPNFEEIGQLLGRFSGGSLRYWHDMGHAYVLEKLGFLTQQSLLDSYGDSLLGVHLHDALGTDDHRAPGMGEIDFRAFSKTLCSAQIKAMEVHKKADRRQLLSGRDLLERIGLT